MNHFRLFLLICGLSLYFSPSEAVDSQQKLNQAEINFLQSFFCRIDAKKLVGHGAEYLRKVGADFDQENQTWFYEFGEKNGETILATMNFADNKSLKIRVFPPLSTGAPYFCGQIKRNRGKLLLRGTFSDYSRQTLNTNLSASCLPHDNRTLQEAERQIQ
jgi:hypothetical protein